MDDEQGPWWTRPPEPGSQAPQVQRRRPNEPHDVEYPAEASKSVTDMVEQPAKAMRIGNMIRQLLDEVKAAPLDDASRQVIVDTMRRFEATFSQVAVESNDVNGDETLEV